MDYLTGSSVPETIWHTGIDPVIRGWSKPGGEEGGVGGYSEVCLLCLLCGCLNKQMGVVLAMKYTLTRFVWWQGLKGQTQR